MLGQTAERISSSDISDNYVFQRSLLAYNHAVEMIRGNVLEIGTGMGYALPLIAAKADYVLTLDKFENKKLRRKFESILKVSFRKQKVPPLKNIPENYFDYVLAFQVIEHIPKDSKLLTEIYRVLKPGGKLIITTPNKLRSLSRNPWHIREYEFREFNTLLSKHFDEVSISGVFGNHTILQYYHENVKAIKRLERLDFFRLRERLPRWCLILPYNFLNRLNRKKLSSLGEHIREDDYYLAPAAPDCFDLFGIAEKKTDAHARHNPVA